MTELASLRQMPIALSYKLSITSCHKINKRKAKRKQALGDLSAPSIAEGQVPYSLCESCV